MYVRVMYGDPRGKSALWIFVFTASSPGNKEKDHYNWRE